MVGASDKKEEELRYDVVVFDEDKEVEVVPLIWLCKNESSCRWPADGFKGNVEKMVKKCLPLEDKNTSLFPCRVIYKAGK